MPATLAIAKVVEFMLTRPPVVESVGTKVFAGKKLPTDFDLNPNPSAPDNSGECILIDSPTGENNYSDTNARLRVSFMCFAQTDVRALELAEVVVFQAMNSRQGGKVLWANLTGRPEIVDDPQGSGWPVGLAYYDVWVRLT